MNQEPEEVQADAETLVSNLIKSTMLLTRANPGEAMLKANEQQAEARAALLRFLSRQRQMIDSLERSLRAEVSSEGQRHEFIGGACLVCGKDRPSPQHFEVRRPMDKDEVIAVLSENRTNNYAENAALLALDLCDEPDDHPAFPVLEQLFLAGLIRFTDKVAPEVTDETREMK